MSHGSLVLFGQDGAVLEETRYGNGYGMSPVLWDVAFRSAQGADRVRSDADQGRRYVGPLEERIRVERARMGVEPRSTHALDHTYAMDWLRAQPEGDPRLAWTRALNLTVRSLLLMSVLHPTAVAREHWPQVIPLLLAASDTYDRTWPHASNHWPAVVAELEERKDDESILAFAVYESVNDNPFLGERDPEDHDHLVPYDVRTDSWWFTPGEQPTRSPGRWGIEFKLDEAHAALERALAAGPPEAEPDARAFLANMRGTLVGVPGSRFHRPPPAGGLETDLTRKQLEDLAGRARLEASRVVRRRLEAA